MLVYSFVDHKGDTKCFESIEMRHSEKSKKMNTGEIEADNTENQKKKIDKHNKF